MIHTVGGAKKLVIRSASISASTRAGSGASISSVSAPPRSAGMVKACICAVW